MRISHPLRCLLASHALLVLIVAADVFAQHPSVEQEPASAPLPPPPPAPSGVVPVWQVPSPAASSASSSAAPLAAAPSASSSASTGACAPAPSASSTTAMRSLHPHGRGGFVADVGAVLFTGTYTIPLRSSVSGNQAQPEDQVLTCSGQGFSVTLGGKGALIPGLYLGGRVAVHAIFISNTDASGSRVRGLEVTSAILTFIEPFVEWYVRPSSGIFLQASGGPAAANVMSPTEGPDLRQYGLGHPAGVGFSVGAGYRHRVSDSAELGGLFRLHGLYSWETAREFNGRTYETTATFTAVYPTLVVSMVAM